MPCRIGIKQLCRPLNLVKVGEFKNISNSTDIAWRLIAFVCGLEGIYQLGLQGLAEEDFKRHTEAIIRLELL